ncbi:hypothetical protein B0H13DRAFT_2565871 [Mycena leptocephala]|nr:hypothetical protein B0H13DRAFT_2565871 [Mycena leptocephala]
MASSAGSAPDLSLSSSSSAPATAVAPPLTAAKRKYHEVLVSLSASAPAEPQKSNKRAKREPYYSSDTKSPQDQLVCAAQFLVRGIDCNLDVGMVLTYGAAHHWNPPPAAAPRNTIVIPQSELDLQKKHVDAFDKMMAQSPGCLEVVREFYAAEDATHWTQLVKLFRVSAKAARQQDTHDLKAFAEYVLAENENIIPSLSKGPSKSDRGIGHPVLRKYLVSWTIRNEITELADPDPEDAEEEENAGAAKVPELSEAAKKALHSLLHNGTDIDASESPSCFWDDDKYDSDDTEKNLFRSQFLARVARHIWTGPSTAYQLAKAIPKRCKARTHGVCTMTAEMLGYGRTILSTSDWDTLDGLFNYEDMLEAILALFKTNPQDPWAVETLAWYQESSVLSPAPRRPAPPPVHPRTPPPRCSPSAQCALSRPKSSLIVLCSAPKPPKDPRLLSLLELLCIQLETVPTLELEIVLLNG